MVRAVTTNHLELDDLGRVRIAGTRTRITMIAMDVMNGLNAEQIHEAYPYLSLAQIHAALSYYHDHKDQIDAEIKKELRDSDQMRQDSAAAKKQLTRHELEQRRNQRPSET